MFKLRKYFTNLNLLQLVKRISTSGRHCSEELNVHRDSDDNNPNTPFEFTEANMTRLAALIQNYPEGAQRSAVSAAMDIVQRQIGWIPISAMHKVAELLQMPRMRVYEWATFYTMNKSKEIHKLFFKMRSSEAADKSYTASDTDFIKIKASDMRFRGKFHVKVCVTTPCMLRGSDVILRAVEEATCCCEGSLSEDGMFGVDTVQCQGACVNAPVLVVNDDYYEDVNVFDVHNIIQMLRCGGIPPFGPQNGRFSCEPCGGQTTLCECPPPPGFGLQPSLYGPCTGITPDTK